MITACGVFGGSLVAASGVLRWDSVYTLFLQFLGISKWGTYGYCLVSGSLLDNV